VDTRRRRLRFGLQHIITGILSTHQEVLQPNPARQGIGRDRLAHLSGIPNLNSASYGPAPVMLVGNKCDRVTEREVSTQEGSALTRELGCDFVEASAKNCVNVERAFYDVVRQLRRQRHQSIGGGKSSEKKKEGQRSNNTDSHRDNKRKDGGRSKSRSSGKCVIL